MENEQLNKVFGKPYSQDELNRAALDLLETLRRAYFLIEIRNIKDDYFEALRRKIVDFLPSQIVDMKLLAEAIEQNR